MFTLLLKTAHGWTDNLGHNVNQWPTEDAAQAAAAELDWAWCATSEWKVVLTADLGNYDLVA